MPTRPLLAALVALTALAACQGNQPRTYRVALDLTPVRFITDGKCFKNNEVPAPNESTANLFDEQQWVVWDGVQQDGSSVQFLDFGKQQFKLGDSPQVEFSDLVRSFASVTPGVFTGQRVLSSVTPSGGGNVVQTATTIITVTFNDLGNAPYGRLDIDSRYACTGVAGGVCPLEQAVASPRSCAVAVPFVARKIDIARVAEYQEEGKND
ncbi:MAG: hypothetical protein JNK82_16390 [Myxococcaceae bacterium]|nr:hypothetical protein [Myxococcaceae bacterium]